MSASGMVKWNLVLIFGIAMLMAFSPGAVAAGATVASAPAPSVGSLVPLAGPMVRPADLALGSPLAPDHMVVGSLTFQTHDPQGQAQLIQDLYDPSSPLYHQFLTGNQFNELFGPSPQAQASLESYLTSQGVQVSPVGPLMWNVQGPASAMDAAFGTTYVTARAPGHVGYYPATPLQLPSSLASLVKIDGGFQTVNPPVPQNLLQWSPLAGSPVAANPAATITLNMSMNGPFFIYAGTGTFVNPPTNYNGSYQLNITGGTAPYSVSWHWGDGTINHFTTSAAQLKALHMYYNPAQADYCNSAACWNITVFVNDSGGNSVTYTVGVFPGISPRTLQTFYDILPLYAMGHTGAGTKIGLDEMCDPSYTSYLADANRFSLWMGLPQFTTSTLQLIGSGNTAAKCTSGSSGWAGETMLDIEWAHSMAPNATLEVDLSNSAIDEGDGTWNTLSNGVYITSNSWGASYTTSYWTTAAAQGQSYLSASGDCGSLDLSTGSDPPADSPYGVGVGGTQVYPLPSGGFRAEFAWNGTNDPTCTSTGANDAGSGGGYSKTIAAPAYQTGMTGFSNTHRGIPDIAAIGGTWVVLYDSSFSTKFSLSAGTSLATPASAAMLDIMYQYNGTATKANGMADYDLYAIAKTSNYHIGFHDIVVGNNKVSGSGYTTTPGWDAVTGLGSFNVSQLAQLVAAQNANPSPTATLTAILSANVTFGPASLGVGFSADVAGGPASLTGYSYAWTFGDGGTATTSTYYTTHAYTTPGIYQATVTVTGGSSTATSNSVTVHVTGTAVSGPTISAFTASPATIPSGGTTYLNVTATGGVGPLTYAYTGQPGTCPSANATQLVCSTTVTSTTTYTVTVTVSDSASTPHTATKTATFTVNAPVGTGPTISAFTASPVIIPSGGTTYLNVTATGGVGPLSYAYTGQPASCPSANATQLVCSTTATATTAYTVTVTVSDSASTPHTATKTASFTVNVPGTGPVISTFTASPGTIPSGGTTYLNVSATGGVGPLTYAYTGQPGTCPSVNATQLVCSTTVTSTTTYTVTVTVSDSASTPHTATKTTTFTVNAPAGSGPTINSFTASPTTIPWGGTTYLNVTASGGATPYTYAYHSLPAGCTSANVASLACSPSGAGTSSVTVTVTGANGLATTSSAVTFTVYTLPAITSFTASPATIPSGGTTFLNVTAAGGTGSLSYAYAGLPSDCATANTAALTCTSAVAGPYTVTVTVTDQASHTATDVASFTVEPASTRNPPTIAAFTASPGTIPQGGTVYLNVTATGGTSPYQYLYQGLPPGCGSLNTANLVCTPTASGTYSVAVTVTDAKGLTAQSSTTFTVTAASSSQGSGSGLDLVGYALIAGIVILGVVLVVVLATRRKPPATQIPSWVPPQPHPGSPGAPPR